MKTIKAIQTLYKGYYFRSRLEARWAVFLDSLALNWEYEKEGFELANERYLPDFWISTVNMWAEVKPDNGFDKDAMIKVVQLANQTGYPVLLLEGVPENKPYMAIDKDGYDSLCCLTNYHNYPQKEHRFFGNPSDYEMQWGDTELASVAARSARF